MAPARFGQVTGPGRDKQHVAGQGPRIRRMRLREADGARLRAVRVEQARHREAPVTDLSGAAAAQQQRDLRPGLREIRRHAEPDRAAARHRDAIVAHGPLQNPSFAPHEGIPAW